MLGPNQQDQTSGPHAAADISWTECTQLHSEEAKSIFRAVLQLQFSSLDLTMACVSRLIGG